MALLHVIYGLASLSQSKILATPMHKTMSIPDTACCILVLLSAPLRVVAYSIAKAQNIR